MRPVLGSHSKRVQAIRPDDAKACAAYLCLARDISDPRVTDAHCPNNLRVFKLGCNRAHDPQRNIVLKIKDIFQCTIESARPQMRHD
jgi:hypothetical protein